MKLKCVFILLTTGWLFISVGADCTSCSNVPLTCDTDTAAKNAVNGIFTQTFGIDAHGCKTVTLGCVDDANVTSGYLEDLVNGFFFMSGDNLTCQSNGTWISGSSPLSVYCDVSNTATVAVPTCMASTALPASSTMASASSASSTLMPTSPGSCCSEWSSWSATSQCPDNCGSIGIVNYTRTCLTPSCPCSGESSKVDYCNQGPCSFPRKSCQLNFKAQALNGEILCLTTNQTIALPPQTCSCCTPGGIWSSWIDVTCNDTCGGYGTGIRRRKCLSTAIGCPCTGSETKTDNCKLSPCFYPRASCNTGLKARALAGTIQCLETIVQITSSTTCCPKEGIWETWGKWSTCSATCGACANATRHRICASATNGCPCVGNATDTLPCNRQACTTGVQCCIGSAQTLGNEDVVCSTATVVATGSQWSEWTNSTCSGTCGLCGTIQQTRICLSGSCSGLSQQSTTIPCGDQLCSIELGLPSCCSPATRALNGTTFYCA